jgi:4-aminobutyrate aminotransferase-like enzyme
VTTHCYERNPNMLTAGTFNKVIRVLVPLLVTDSQFDEGPAILEAGLASVAERIHAALARE